FESFITTALGAVTVTAVLATLSRDTVSKWFWWFTVVVGVVLTVTGILEGLGDSPSSLVCGPSLPGLPSSRMLDPTIEAPAHQPRQTDWSDT
ncbi:MAG: hypothetical protein ACE1ZX_05800, partial [Acidimicrobiia bacterium]